MKKIRNKRIVAFIIDMIIAIAFSLLVYSILHSLNIKVVFEMIGIIGLAVLIGKDCVNGMSIGKFITGIQVIDTKTRQIASPQKCVIRNLFYFLHLIEIIAMLTNFRNLRIGDHVAHTEVTLYNKSLVKVKLSQELLAIGYILVGLAIMEVIYYFRASTFGLL